jgi:hypothetical protein
MRAFPPLWNQAATVLKVGEGAAVVGAGVGDVVGVPVVAVEAGAVSVVAAEVAAVCAAGVLEVVFVANMAQAPARTTIRPATTISPTFAAARF